MMRVEVLKAQCWKRIEVVEYMREVRGYMRSLIRKREWEYGTLRPRENKWDTMAQGEWSGTLQPREN